MGPSDEPIIDEGVLQATLKEVEAGVVEGPVDPKSLPPGATLTRRFGVTQGEVDGVPKVRPIDNYRASRVNAAVTQSEQVTVHTLDVVAGMVSSWLARAKEQNANTPLAAKTWDLKAAYKQLPLSDFPPLSTGIPTSSFSTPGPRSLPSSSKELCLSAPGRL